MVSPCRVLFVDKKENRRLGKLERRKKQIKLLLDAARAINAAIRMREINKNLPILFHTGYGEGDVYEAMKKIEHAIIVYKPVQVAELSYVVKNLLQSKSQL